MNFVCDATRRGRQTQSDRTRERAGEEEGAGEEEMGKEAGTRKQTAATSSAGTPGGAPPQVHAPHALVASVMERLR